MTTYNTGNPLGSTAVKDLYDNAENFDNGMNSTSPAFFDRFGKRRETWTGMQKLVQDYLIAAGFVYLADYATGVTFTARNQYVIRDGLPYAVADSTDLPFVLTGTWATDEPSLRLIGDAPLRQDLANSSDVLKGTTMLGMEGQTLRDWLGTNIVPEFLDRTALKVHPVRRNSEVVYLNEGLRAGLFASVLGTIPTADPNEAIYIASTTSPTYYWERLGAEHVNFQWCGVDINYTSTVNNWAAWIQAIRFCGATGMPLYVPAGRYGFVQPPQIDMSDFKTAGLVIYGDGHARSILDMRSVLTSPNMLVWGAPTVGAAFGDTYYLNMRDIGMIGNIGAAVGSASYVLQIGQDDFSDPANLYNWEGVGVQNFDTSGHCRAVKMNYVVGGKFDIQFNGGSGGYIGGEGIALTMRRCGFNQFFGSIGSASEAIRIDDEFCFGNQFNCVDMENVAICVRVTSANAQSNTWIGGRWAYSVCGFDGQAGLSNVVINPNIGPSGTATPGGFFAATVGVQLVGAHGVIPITSPPVGASGADITNTTGRQVSVGISGGSVSQIRVNGTAYGFTSGGGFVTIGPGETIGVTYSAAPFWIWRAL